MLHFPKTLNMKLITPFFALSFFQILNTVHAQDSTAVLMATLEKQNKPKTEYATYTFTTTRLINGHTVENTPPGVMDFRISHRFGETSGGAYTFFGLDEAVMRLGFDFGITKYLMIGIGHDTHIKTYDAFFKLRLLRQSKGRTNFPVTVSFVPTIAINTFSETDLGKKVEFSDRLSNVFQLLIARKFNEKLSLQLMPTLVHHDNVSYPAYINVNTAAIGICGREKISRRVSINAEYYYQLPDMQAPGSTNSLSFSVDIVTGGHVFQLLITNAEWITEKAFISETTGRWDKGNIRLGFNVLRVFHLKHDKKV